MADNTYKTQNVTYDFHTFYDVALKIYSNLQLMLAYYPRGASDWKVAQSNQPTIQALQDKTVYFDVISRRRIGQQGSIQRENMNNRWYSCPHWFEEWIIQVSCFSIRNPNDDPSSTTFGVDIASYLQGCVNSVKGVQNSDRAYFSESWIDVIRSGEIREIDFETDSGLKEKFPQFDFGLVIEQTLAIPENSVQTVATTVQGV